MRQRVTQLEALLRSFIELDGAEIGLEHESDIPSSQAVYEAAKVLGPPDSTEQSPNDVEMYHGGAATTGSDETHLSPGQITLDETQTSYVGNAHWGAVLNEVS